MWFGPGPVHGTVLSDGFVKATWSIDGSTLTVRHAGLDDAAAAEVAEEGAQLLRFLGSPDGEVRLVSSEA
jgi:hypothetical protein